MVVSHFLKWIHTARVSERAAAASALARAYINAELPFEDRCAAEAALTLLLDDASSKVRLAIAEALSMSPRVSMAVAAAIAEIGEPEACAALLANSGADIASLSFRRIAERHGHLPSLREALISDARLPADCRHMLLIKLGETLKGSPLVLALMGRARTERVMRDACVKASLTLIEGTRQEEHAALIEHLRLRGDLTASFIIRTIAHGKVDFFGSALVALSQQSEQRVRALLAGGHDVALQALLRSAGLAAATHAIILRALKVWREVANGKRLAGVQEVSWLMLKELGGQSAEGDLAGLVKSIHLDALRENARGHALAIAAA
ncbi:MAG: DUF2336 domain-containing protein [Mesorhizobium sp.]|uniref:DUF2336 domain-containing protein n=1 Tax=Mesorhizobium sp. TaxID=1871066 RepID=UPI001202995D|nr:DUF2336 domain-containing protein [Mesorhizobium sp.]TIM28129.1 MAG: DUF2336 domain-containing protein [Mesorhizobium sp.]